MIENAILRLRAERPARTTRPLPVRGNRIRHCQRRLLLFEQCLYATLVPVQAISRFCLVMSDAESMKSSNAGRLIADTLLDTEAFQWSGTELPQELLDLAAYPDYQPVVVSPALYAGPEYQILSAPPSGKPPLFVILDGTWTETRKMFRKNPHFDMLPIIPVDLLRTSVYHLREAHADGQYCTTEAAIALLDPADDAPAAVALDEYFTHFRARHLTERTQYKGSITANQVEGV